MVPQTCPANPPNINFFSALLHLEPDPGRHPGVVQGAVVLPVEAGLRKEVQVDRFQRAVDQAGEAEAAHLQRTDVPVGKAHFQPGELVAEKADVEGGVVCHQDAVGNEGAEAREGLLRRRLACEHLVGDAVDRLDDGRDRDPGVDQGCEFLYDGAVFDGNRADLDDPVALPRRKPGCFEIDDHMAVNCAHLFFRDCCYVMRDAT
jgi:hypothetical protein